MQKLTANYICPVNTTPIKEGVVVIDEAGKILEIGQRSDYDTNELTYHEGVIIPGFINTHCHLELSHMKGKVNTGTTLIPFITSVVQNRNASEEEIQTAIATAEKEMYDGGIVAVGDISNVVDTFAQKNKGNIRYYTFVEFFDFFQDQNTQAEFDKYKAVHDALELTNGSQKSCSPHAPYSVSETLFSELDKAMPKEGKTISIHNQETIPENELFLHGTGGFVDFYASFGISLNGFTVPKTTSIHYALKHMNPNNKTLFVHNTLTTREDIKAAQTWSDKVYWATCPNANLYIENRLPNYQAFLDTNARMTIGTDSLTSNWQLSILEEMKAIAKYQSYIDFHTMLRWATLNGAEALGFDADLGSIEVGKSPGLSLLSLNEEWRINQNTTVKRLV